MGIIAADSPVEARPAFEKNSRRIRTEKYGDITHAEMGELIDHIGSQSGREVHSDGFLSLSFMDTAYTCSTCGFRGIFRRENCIKCDTPLNSKG